MAAAAADEGASIKKRVLLRLAIAGGITLAALLGLWLLDKNQQPAEKPKVSVPKPIVTAPAEPVPPPEVLPLPPEAPQELPPPEEPPPPPAVSNLPATAPLVAVPPPAAKAAPSPAPAPTTAAPRAGRPAAAPATTEGEFVVRLGVFSNPDNAKELVERLQRQGVRAYSETRVQVGPFATRQEAEHALTELRRLGLKPVIATAGATK